MAAVVAGRAETCPSPSGASGNGIVREPTVSDIPCACTCAGTTGRSATSSTLIGFGHAPRRILL
jgi:hypothetical protein